MSQSATRHDTTCPVTLETEFPGIVAGLQGGGDAGVYLTAKVGREDRDVSIVVPRFQPPVSATLRGGDRAAKPGDRPIFRSPTRR